MLLHCHLEKRNVLFPVIKESIKQTPIHDVYTSGRLVTLLSLTEGITCVMVNQI